jgi:type VI secretion system protein ImpB
MPGEKSLQHKLDRVRAPRVQITYDVETNGSPVKKELPFVLGVMADLAGHPDPDKDVEPLKDRIFTEINRDSFSKVMEAIQPRLEMRVKNELQKDGSKIALEIDFKSIDDFEPENVVNRIHAVGDPDTRPLQKLLEIRRKLADLKRKAVSNDRLDSVLQKIIQTTDEIKKRSLQGPGSTTAGEA